MRRPPAAPLAACLSLAAVLAAPARGAGLCRKWGEAALVGVLDPGRVPEASGLAVSRKWERLYHINDSGGGPVFYVSDLRGGNLKKVHIDDFLAVDTEDLSLGPCGSRTCLFVADIGDNFSFRKDIEVALVVERKDFPEFVKPLRVLSLRYPDGAHNAEGLAVHPNGDLFIVVKEEPKKKGTRAARVLRLARDKVMKGRGMMSLEPWGELDIPAINADTEKWGKIVTSFDIAPDGKSFLLLTYRNAVEFALDLSAGPIPASLAEGKDYARVPLKVLIQQESVAYLPDRSGFLYGTEFVPAKDKTQKAPELYLVPCLAPPGR